jgi:transposase, IS5 family
MKQPTLAGFEKFVKTTRRAQYPADMDQIIPCPQLAAAVQTVYPKISENGGRPPIPLERMLRIYFVQLWFKLSDQAVEEALCDAVAMRNVVGSGIKSTNGAIVDATIIGAPSSTRNQGGKGDPGMHQTAKGQQWYFGTKAHIDVGSRTKLVHAVQASTANVVDREALPYLLRGYETRVWGDQGYQGQTAVVHARAPNAKDFTNRRYRHHGRACVRRDQEHLWLPQDLLPRSDEEPAPAGSDRCSRQPPGRPTTIAERAGEVSVKSGNARLERESRQAAPRSRAASRARLETHPAVF